MPELTKSDLWDGAMPQDTPKSNDDLLVIYGGSVKAIAVNSDGSFEVEGRMVTFTNPEMRDLQGEYFSSDTDFMEDAYPLVGITLYHHGIDPDLEVYPIGEVYEADKRADGIWGKARIDFGPRYKKYIKSLSSSAAWKAGQEALADEYQQILKGMVDNGKLGYSMGALPQSVIVDKGHIKRWAIIERTLTPAPAQPWFTGVTPLKSLPMFSLRGLMAGEVKTDASGMSVIQSDLNIQDESNMDLEQIKQIIQDILKPMLALFTGNVEEEVTEDEDAALLADAEKEAMDEVPEEEEEYKSLTRARLEQIAIGGAKTAIARFVEQRETRAEAMKAAIAAGVDDGRKAALNGREGKSKVKSYSPDADGKKGSFNINYGAEPPTWIDTIKSMLPGASSDQRRKSGIVSVHNEFVDAAKAQNPYIGPLGGFTVEQTLRDQILDPLRPEVISFGLGVQQTPSAGAGVVILPKMTTAPSAFRPGINTAITASQAQFNTVTAFLRPIAAEVIVPIQMLDTALPQAEQKIKEQMVKSIALQIDQEIFVGTGTVEGSNTGAGIRGILQVASSANQVTLSTNGRAPGYQDLVDAQTQIAIQNVPEDPTMGWAFHPRTRGTFYGMVDNVGQPLWRPDVATDAYRTILGYKSAVSTQIPINVTTGDNADTSYIFYGRWNFAEYIMANDMAIFVNPYIYANQLQVQLLAYTFSDFIVHYPEAFYVMKGVRA